MIDAFARGAWLGFCIAAPVGPIGILVMKQSLRSGWLAGLSSGLGAAIADLLYGCLAVAGVQMLPEYGRFVSLTGGFFLLWLAWKSWHEKPASSESASRTGGTLSTFLLTVSNPMTILFFAATVASSGADAPIQFVTGVFTGSMLWWTILSVTAGRLRSWMETRSFLLSKAAAVTLASFGIWAVFSRSIH
jgi:threonine/homoserine/homoserine lactone efflux protein